MEKMELPSRDATNEDWERYNMNDVEILKRLFLSYVRFLIEEDLGAMQKTIPSQAFHAFRHRFMKHKIYIHNNEDALFYERESYYGGRNEVFKIGKTDGKIYILDVNSMYPYVMRDNYFPTRLVKVRKKVKKYELKEWLNHYCAIAYVRVRTDEPVYPKRLRGKLLFPVGSFDTVLCTPELKYAFEHDHIDKVFTVCLYQKGKIFEDYVNFFYEKRLEYKRAGNKAYDTICKLFLNSLYGKFGQRGKVWRIVDYPLIDDGVFEWFEYDTSKGEMSKYRKVGNVVMKLVDEEETWDSFPAISAHVTAYARMHLWSMIKTAGRNNVLYCDTDSLFTNEEGYQNLLNANLVDNAKLGFLKLEKEANGIEIRGCKDYKLDTGEEKIKGVRKNAERIDENTFRQEEIKGFMYSAKMRKINTVFVELRTKVLRRVYDKGIVKPDGVVVPFRLFLPPASYLARFLYVLFRFLPQSSPS